MQNEHSENNPLSHESTMTPEDYAAHAGEVDHGVAHEGDHGGHEAHVPELENFWNLLSKTSLNNPDMPTHHIIKHFDPYVEDPYEATLHKTNQNVFFGLVAIILTIVLARWALRKRAMIPDRAQSAAEILIEGLNNFFLSILGVKYGPRYIPFLLALFFFILVSNLMGLIPLLKSSTSTFQTNVVLGLCVFIYVQYTGLRYNGPKKYFLHLLGNPQGPVMWVMAPFLLVIEILGELIKPLSLSLRLFGNILGEDILLGVFAMLGVAMMAVILPGIDHPIVGIPLHLPFMFLATLTSTIQALIFALLSCVYVMLMLPHEEHSE
ncbi:MAG: F0F1 ATP synthase subunit A [Candidatus Sumerlaeia bacterium]